MEAPLMWFVLDNSGLSPSKITLERALSPLQKGLLCLEGFLSCDREKEINQQKKSSFTFYFRIKLIKSAKTGEKFD